MAGEDDKSRLAGDRRQSAVVAAGGARASLDGGQGGGLDGGAEISGAVSPAHPAGGRTPEQDGVAVDQEVARRLERRRVAGHHGVRNGPLPEIYAALDLGTNNCRLLVARPSRRGFMVVDAFSRIIRLGEGITTTGRLSEPAMARTSEALRICASKMGRHRVERYRLVATEACRVAANGSAFLSKIKREVGLDIEMLSRENEAKLAVSGCASLIDTTSDLALVFDIGGGSSELIWLDLNRRPGSGRRATNERFDAHGCIAAWTSLPVGVVTLADRFGGRFVTPAIFETMVSYVSDMIAPFEAEHGFKARIRHENAHLLGTSGTVTTVAGIHMGLPRYDRSKVDGCWLDTADIQRITYGLVKKSYEERVAEPCIGRDRADLVLAGCAILEAILRTWPAQRLRVADRGLREGILATLMAEDGHHRPGRGRYGRQR